MILMWDYDHDVLPISLRGNFKRANMLHNYSTRAASKGSLYHSKVITFKHGIQSFKYQCVKVLNKLKNMGIYQCATSKSKFLKELKTDYLYSYIA